MINTTGYVEPQTNFLPFDVVVVFGASFREKDGETILGILGKLRMMAAAELMKQGTCLNLILTGGHTKGIEKPSEAEVMLNFLEKKYGRAFSSDNIYLEDKAKDTSTNIDNVIKFLKMKKWKRVGLLSNKFHLKRIELLASAFRLDAQILSAEKILLQLGDGQLSKEIRDYYQLPKIMPIYALELIYTSLLIIDKKGKIGKFLSRLIRN